MKNVIFLCSENNMHQKNTIAVQRRIHSLPEHLSCSLFRKRLHLKCLTDSDYNSAIVQITIKNFCHPVKDLQIWFLKT